MGDDDGVVTGRDRGEIVKAVLTALESPVGRGVSEAVLAVCWPGGGESVQTAARTGAVEEGAGQQVHRGHGARHLLQRHHHYPQPQLHIINIIMIRSS